MVAPAFGFSVGDFLAAIKLLKKAAKALQESSGATSQFQQAAVEIESIHDVLNRVQSLRPRDCNEGTIRKVHLCALSCHIPLARFIAKLKELEPHLAHSTEARDSTCLGWRLAKTRQKLEWAFTLKSELAKLKQQLGLLFAAISISLQLESLDRAASLQKASQNAVAETSRYAGVVQTTLQEIKDRVVDKHPGRNEAENASDASRSTNSSHKCLEKDGELIVAARQMCSNTFKLQARFAIVEDLLAELKQQINNDDPAPTMTSTMTPTINTSPTKATQYSISPLVEMKSPAEVTTIFAIISSIRHGIEQILLMLLLMLPSIQQIYRTFQQMRRNPSLLLHDNIHLEDALGRSLSLPYEHFRYWPVFFARLQSSFVGMPGEWNVKHNQFRLNSHDNTGVIMTGECWPNMVFPGSRWVMSMPHRMTDFENCGCPRCQAPCFGTAKGFWLQCIECSLIYRVSNEQRSRPKRSHQKRKKTEHYDDIVPAESQRFKRLDFIVDRATDRSNRRLSSEYPKSHEDPGLLRDGDHFEHRRQRSPKAVFREYSKQELFHLRDSSLVERPMNMPAIEQWYDDET